MNNISKQHNLNNTKSSNEPKRTPTKSSNSKNKSNKDLNRSKDSINQINKTKTLKNAYNKNTRIDETKTSKKIQCQYCHMTTSEEEIEKIKFSCLHKICFACVSRYFIHTDFQTFSIDGPLTAQCPICKDKETSIHWKDIDKVIKTSTVLRKEIIKDNCTAHNKESKEYCKECKKWLCEECFHEFHDKVFGREHSLLANKPYLLGGCSLHNNRIKEMYCLDCHKDICYFCLRNGEEHDGHRNMTVKDYKAKLKLSKKVFMYKEYEEFKDALKEIEDKFRNDYEKAFEQNEMNINKIIQYLEEIKEKYIKRKADNLRFIKNLFNAIRICYYHFYEDLNIKDPVIKILNHIRNVNKEIKDVLFVSNDYTDKLAKINNDLSTIQVDKMFQYEIKFEYHDLHLIRNHQGNKCQIYSIVEVENGDLVTGGNDGVVRVWDGENGKIKIEIEEQKGIVFTLAFINNDKKLLVSGGEDSCIRLWDFCVINEVKKAMIEEENKKEETDKSELIKESDSLKKTKLIGNIENKESKMEQIIEENVEEGGDVDSSKNKNIVDTVKEFTKKNVVSSGGSKGEELFDQNKEDNDFENKEDNYYFDNDYNSSVKESDIKESNKKEGKNILNKISSQLTEQGLIKSSKDPAESQLQPNSINNNNNNSTNLNLNKTTSVLIESKNKYTITNYDVESPPIKFQIQPFKQLSGHKGNIYSITELEGNRLCSCAHDKLIIIWSLKDYTIKLKLEGHTNAVGCVLNYNSQFLISGGVDKRLFIWEFNDSNILVSKRALVGHTNSVFSLDKLPNGKVVSGSCDHSVRVWDIHERKCEWVFKGHEGFVWKVLALNDGKVISVGSDRTLRVWDVYEKKCLNVVLAHKADITCVVLLKDGKFASGSVDGLMKVWGL